MTTKRLPLRDAIARIERRDPVLPALLSFEAAPEPYPELKPEVEGGLASGDRRTVSVDVRIDRDVFVRYRTLQHELRQSGHEEPTLRAIVSALLTQLPADADAVHLKVATWRATDPASQRPYAERDLHRLRVDVATSLVRRVEDALFQLEVQGRALALTEVIRACLAQGPRSTSELSALLADHATSPDRDLRQAAATATTDAENGVGEQHSVDERLQPRAATSGAA